jgi:hypothetical protein
MTKAKPGAWAQCDCGKRYRAGNPAGMCGACNAKRMNAERCKDRASRRKTELLQGETRPVPSDINYAVQLAHDALMQARGHDHDVFTMEPDAVPGAYIGRCLKCGGYVAVDVMETPQAYGKAHEQPCPGQRSWEPAPRRDPMLDPTVYTSAGSERADYGNPFIPENPYAQSEQDRWA